MDPSGLRQDQPPGGTDAELVEASATITYYRPAGGFAGDLRMVEVTLR
jgi:hypothetical protein